LLDNVIHNKSAIPAFEVNPSVDGTGSCSKNGLVVDIEVKSKKHKSHFNGKLHKFESKIDEKWYLSMIVPSERRVSRFGPLRSLVDPRDSSTSASMAMTILVNRKKERQH